VLASDTVAHREWVPDLGQDPYPWGFVADGPAAAQQMLWWQDQGVLDDSAARWRRARRRSWDDSAKCLLSALQQTITGPEMAPPEASEREDCLGHG